VPIHLYSLYSDPKSDWKKVYADQSELLEYLEGLIEKHGKSDDYLRPPLDSS
jgi:cation diffusion facilitator CzcD-associated flavoprotein CzcO